MTVTVTPTLAIKLCCVVKVLSHACFKLDEWLTAVFFIWGSVILANVCKLFWDDRMKANKEKSTIEFYTLW